jgi:hypothetical protein
MLYSDKMIYDDLIIELGSERVNRKKGNKHYKWEKRVWLVVKNGEREVRNCRVVLEGLEYHFRDEWILAPNGFDRKALKWNDGKGNIEGKIDISANGSRSLEVAIARRMPNPHFEISYNDGYSGKTHHFIGKYKLRVRIEGRIDGRKTEWEIEPKIYEIYLDYESTLQLGIKDIERVNAT